MIDYELYARIKHLHEDQGLTPTQIAQETGRDIRTVEKWLEEKQFRPRPSHLGPANLIPSRPPSFGCSSAIPSRQNRYCKISEEKVIPAATRF